MMKTSNAVFRCTKCGDDFQKEWEGNPRPRIDIIPPCPKCKLAAYVRFVGWESDDAAPRNQSL